MHIIQQKILNLAKEQNLAGLTLRKIGEMVGETGSPQKIKHHLDKLIEKGMLFSSADGKELKAFTGGIDSRSNLISLPIFGSANCGEALNFAEQNIEGYLKISLKILGEEFKNKISDLFILRAVGQSMNRASIKEKNIEEGDFVIVDKTKTNLVNGDYIVSAIDGMANVKKFIDDRKNNQIILMSESSLNLPPIYIHKDDYSNYLICGKVVDVIKKPDEFLSMRDVSAGDVLKNLGPISKEEVEYYENL